MFNKQNRSFNDMKEPAKRWRQLLQTSGVERDGTNTQEICFREDVVGAWKAVSKVYRSEDGRGNGLLKNPSHQLCYTGKGEERRVPEIGVSEIVHAKKGSKRSDFGSTSYLRCATTKQS